jgi:RNA polymerase sigma-70 factor (ECF subfamily)
MQMENVNVKELLAHHARNQDHELTSYSDELIISKVTDGEAKLFEIIVQRYNQQLFRIVRGYVTNKEDAEDVMQSAYLKAFENLDQFRGEAQFSTWLIRIAINEALKKLKHRKNTTDLSVTDRQNNDQTINGGKHHTPEAKMIEEDTNEHLEKAIDTLPPKYRSVLIMREMEQMNTKETAEVLDISQANVKVRLHRAKKMLHDELTDMLDEIDLLSFKGEDCNRMTRQVMQVIKEELL